MVRPYGIKGKKRKIREEKYEQQEAKQLQEVEKQIVNSDEEEEKLENGTGDEMKTEGESGVDELSGIPLAPNVADNDRSGGVIFILEKASLEVAKVGKSYQILSAEEHTPFLRRHNKDPAEYRPDIVHQALLTILDSPLNKAGKVKVVYVRTHKGVLFEVKPHVRLPRTYKRFAGIMLELLQKLNITASGKREKLLRVIKNPVTQYLPINSRKIGFSHSSEKLVKMSDYVAVTNNEENLVFVVGAMSHGKIDKDYTDDYVSVSDYPLSAAWCIAKICEAMQNKLAIH